MRSVPSRVIELDLPYPPSVNHYKKVGRIIKTKTGKLYQQRKNTCHTEKFYFDVYILSKQIIPSEWGKFDDTAAFSVNIYVHHPDSRKRDLDNILKVLLDSLVRAHVIPDDSNIHRLYIEKRNIIEHGKVIVRIQEIL